MDVKFPEAFIFGAATSAYQIEGALNEDGRGEVFFDRIFQLANFDADPNIACDHYHRYKADVQLIKELGLQSYRFSIAWARIFPKGSGQINEKGIEFYNNLINELLSNDIEPLATLHHFDMPSALYTKGWQNIETIAAFKQFAEICFERFGDRVTRWITFNEPWVDQFLIPFSIQEFTNPKPSIKQDKKLFAKCLNNLHSMFKAHADAIKACRDLIPEGKIGITLNLAPCYPLTDSKEDKEAAERCDAFLNEWHLGLALKGEYPDDLFNYLQEAVNAPTITDEEMALIKDSKSDFIGVNFYGPSYIKMGQKRFPLNYDEYKGERSREWANNAKVVPEALHEILVRIDRDYNSPIIYITENGCSFGDERLNDEKDEWRIDYLKAHLREVKRAMDDGVKVEGYYAWSLMDNLEWAQGYEERYGLIYIDREHNLKRYIKKSGHWYSEVIRNRGFNT
ncbi:MAG: family 1 glycosylhydrolase [Candidatus Helarchaeota archaeon]|nr:family 1 glycosylhydrolase [Candidatus Helarchaeota archaeon]